MGDSPERPFRVLSLDGGGMRGLYTSILLDRLSQSFAADHAVPCAGLDIGKGFDLIVGTSTGGIIACGLASGISMDHMISLYRSMGHNIFRNPMPRRQLKLFLWLARNLNSAANDSSVLAAELSSLFGDKTTMREVYKNRGIALCIPSVNMKSQNSWVFKTPHDPSRKRDGEYRIVDVCLATCAAPLYFPLACVTDPSDNKLHYAFVDGGLWANNPIIVGLVEALEITGSDRPIEIISVSTCAPPSGEPISPNKTSWGVIKWRAGSKALMASLCAQSSRYTGIAQVLTSHLRQPCSVLRLEGTAPSDAQAKHMDLDCTTPEAMDVLSELASEDADRYFRLANKSSAKIGLQVSGEIRKTRSIDNFSILRDAFMDMPSV